MGAFNFPAGAEDEAYCLEIAQAMVFYFGIPLDDAITRINQQWQHADFAASELLFRESTHYWTRNQIRIERKLESQ